MPSRTCGTYHEAVPLPIEAKLERLGPVAALKGGRTSRAMIATREGRRP